MPREGRGTTGRSWHAALPDLWHAYATPVGGLLHMRRETEAEANMSTRTFPEHEKDGRCTVCASEEFVTASYGDYKGARRCAYYFSHGLAFKRLRRCRAVLGRVQGMETRHLARCERQEHHSGQHRATLYELVADPPRIYWSAGLPSGW